MSDGKKRVIALGFFDGVHVGHAALMRATVAEAKRLGAIPSVMSFDRHPATAITGKPVPMINSNQDRIWLMEHYYGIEEVILAEFNEQDAASALGRVRGGISVSGAGRRVRHHR